MYTPNALNTSAPFVEELPLDILNEPVPCAPAQSVGNLVMWAPLVQLQPQHTPPLFLPEWATSEDFEPESQSYKGGNVMVEEAPTTFSPFSLVDCMPIPHFSFNNFITIAFPDLAGDLDSQSRSPT